MEDTTEIALQIVFMNRQPWDYQRTKLSISILIEEMIKNGREWFIVWADSSSTKRLRESLEGDW